MITNKDIKYHTPANPPYNWAETSYFYCYLPDQDLMAWIYFFARPGVAAMVCDVQIMSGINVGPMGPAYVDIQQHLPMPEDFADFELPNGLAYKANNIREYQLDYRGVNGVELNLNVSGVMEPYDIHDPDMDPLAAPLTEKSIADSGFGEAYANHFDMTCKVRGTLKWQGKVFPVDCLATMDHSWGVRIERGVEPMGWSNAHFGDDMALQAIWKYYPDASIDEQFSLAHGYVYSNGKVSGAIRGSMKVRRMGAWGVNYEMTVVDSEGEEHTAIGFPVAAAEWCPYSYTFVPLVFIKWHYKGRVGYGCSQENNPRDRHSGLLPL